MQDHVYKVMDLVGSSEKSIDDAVQTAVTRASKTVRNLRWFEVSQVRGQIENGKVKFYQVAMKVGFTLDEG
jgi:flavin-binding protein dodecin